MHLLDKDYLFSDLPIMTATIEISCIVDCNPPIGTRFQGLWADMIDQYTIENNNGIVQQSKFHF